MMGESDENKDKEIDLYVKGRTLRSMDAALCVRRVSLSAFIGHIYVRRCATVRSVLDFRIGHIKAVVAGCDNLRSPTHSLALVCQRNVMLEDCEAILHLERGDELFFLTWLYFEG